MAATNKSTRQPRTVKPLDTWHVKHTFRTPEGIISEAVDAIIVGEDNALWMAAAIAAASTLDSVYSVMSAKGDMLLACFNGGGRTYVGCDKFGDACLVTNTPTDLSAHLDIFDEDDNQPDGPCALTSWLEQQFTRLPR